MQLKVDSNGNAKYIIPSVARVKTSQWQIQDFPEEEAPTPGGMGGGANIQFCHIFPETA